MKLSVSDDNQKKKTPHFKFSAWLKSISVNNSCISEHLMYPDCAETFLTLISNYYLHEHKTWPPNEALSLVVSHNANKGDEITFNFSTFPQTKHLRQTKQYLLNFCFQCHLSNSRPCQSAAYGAPKKLHTVVHTLPSVAELPLDVKKC
jgi:hypothetical protein